MFACFATICRARRLRGMGLAKVLAKRRKRRQDIAVTTNERLIV